MTETTRFSDFMKRLDVWRNEDHQDHLVLSRHEVIEFLEGFNEIRWDYK
jgi:hypothetical protein